MPIEFRCSGCNQLLRVPETAAGQQAKCPNCSSVQTIPATSEPAPSARPAVPPPPPMFAGDPANPFAAPSPVGSYEYSSGPLSDMERNGPPWERDGKSFASYWETFKLVLTDPTKTFSTMNRTAGLNAPITFSLCGMVAGWFISMILMFGLAAMFSAANDFPGGDLVSGFAGFACVTVMLPIFAILGLFIQAGIMHLSLMIVGGAKQPFETTFRVVAYVSGCTNWIAMLPYIGAIAGIAQIVYTIFGFMHAHEITGGKAALAVLLPALCCCGLLIFGFLTMAFMVGIAAQN